MRTFFMGVLVALALHLAGVLGIGSADAQVRQEGGLTFEITVTAQAPLPSPSVGRYQGPVNRSSVFHWRLVGGDRCNDRVGCNIPFGLQQSGWPRPVQEALLNKVQTEAGRVVTITRGWQGWMTWGSETRKFHPNVVADFDQNEPATEWSVVYDGLEYVLLRVHHCQNPGGYIRQPTPPPPRRAGFPPVVCQ